MAAIRPARFTRQPPNTPRINRGNQLGARIIEHIPLNGNIRAIVAGTQGTLGSGGAFTSSIKGVGLRGTGSTARGSIPLDLSTKTKITVAFWLYWDTAANDDALAMELGSAYGFANGFIVDPNCSSPAAFMYGTGSSGGGSNLVTFPRPSAGVWHRVALTMDRLAGAGAVGQAYVDGIAQTMTGFPGANTTTGTFTPDTLNLMSRNGTALFGTGNLQDLTFYDGLLTNAQALEDYRNNWQAFHGPQTRLFFDTSGATDTPINPGAGSLTFTGFAPSLARTANQALTAGAGAITFTGYAPSVASSAALNLTPAAGAMTITGYAPSISQPKTLTAGAAAMTVTGYAPTISRTVTGAYSPTPGALTITGFAPTVFRQASVAVNPPAGAMSFVGYAPSVIIATASTSPQLSIVTIMRKSTVNILAPLTNQINTIAKLL